MIHSLKLTETDTVLEIGTGSGYQTALLGKLCKHVYSIDCSDELCRLARETLEALQVENCTVHKGDGYLGLPEVAPFDAIIVSAAPNGGP